MNSQQRVWFAMLGADIEAFDQYMACSNNSVYRSINGLYKYNNLPESALQWAIKEGLMPLLVA